MQPYTHLVPASAQYVRSEFLKSLRLFHTLDKSGDGFVTRDELQQLVEDPNIKHWLKLVDIDVDDLDKLFDLLDDGDGQIAGHEFISGAGLESYHYLHPE